MSISKKENDFSDLSIVIPVRDEEKNIESVITEMVNVFRIKSEKCNSESYLPELLIVNDGSCDNTEQVLKKLKSEYGNVHIYNTGSSNIGKGAAYSIGFKNVRTRYVATMDGDGQDDPRDIINLYKILKKINYETICKHGLDYGRKYSAMNCCTGYRRDFIKSRFFSLIGNIYINTVLLSFCLLKKILFLIFSDSTDENEFESANFTMFRDMNCAIRIMDSRWAETLDLNKGKYRFIPLLLSNLGANVKQVPVNNRPRISGESRYTNFKLPFVLRDFLMIVTKMNQFL